MTGKQHHDHSEGDRIARQNQATLASYLHEQSKHTGDSRREQIARAAAKQSERHLHGRMPTTGGHGRTSGSRS